MCNTDKQIMPTNIKKIVGAIAVSTVLVASTVVPVLGYGGDPPGAPSCNNSVPKKAWLYSAKSSGAGQVDLFWDKVDGASSWTVAYGVQSGKYIYGVSGFGNGDSRSLRVTLLPSGQYYFVVRANNGCMPGPFSNEWVINVGGGSVRLSTSGVTRAVLETEPTVTPRPTAVVTNPKVQSPAATNIPTVTFAPRPQNPTFLSPTPAPKSQSNSGGFFGWLGNIFKSLFGR
ncbi:MAG: hypothetical protein UW73_C0001G0053 [Microgenomates group bacterium GW2011_GWB1_44_8]|nr:MAG: hypothetical protein UW73_C0001G0053 [Microgenomates group bacterium GW2011_GWB1_44_8]